MPKAKVAPLIFNWRTKQSSLKTIPLVFIIAVLVHAFGFYLFKIVYNPSVSLPPKPVQLTLIPKSAQDTPIFRSWLDSEDPAILFTPASPYCDFTKLNIQYIPRFNLHPLRASFSTSSLTELTIDQPLKMVNLIPPDCQPLHQRSHSISSNPPRSIHPDIFISGAIVDFSLPEAFSQSLQSEIHKTILLPTLFEVYINREGDVQFITLIKSSGSSTVDRQLTALFKTPSSKLLFGDHRFKWLSVQVNWRFK